MQKGSENSEQLNLIIANLPGKPGVYQFFDQKGKIVYIGKAKNLRKRVSSYFTKKIYENGKTRILIQKVHDIKYIVVETETDALLLENNLIKKYQPRYNVMLKDDKSFPWICIKNEPFPRVFSTRNIIRDGSLYFGPFTSVVMVKTLLELIRKLYPIRTCKHHLSPENIAQKKFRICLEYHMKNCLGPCEGKQKQEEYNQHMEQIKNIVKGNLKDVSDYLKLMMTHYAGEYKFEEAQLIKEKLEILQKYRSKSTVVNPSIHDVDVFSINEEKQTAYVNFIKVINGAIIQAHTVEMKKLLDEPAGDILAYAITELRGRMGSVSTELIVPFKPSLVLDGIKYTIPKIGDKKKLLELSERNLTYYKLEKQKRENQNKYISSTQRKLETLKKDLRMNQLPVHIECFDNSNIQGTNPVAACVVFKNANPSKLDYRHYNVKTVVGANDFASMEEIVYRRYKRLLDEDMEIPQLVVIDGGKGQLNAALNALDKLVFKRQKPVIIGIAKKLEEIYFPHDPVPLYLDKNSESLKIIQHIRNEAHRFGIAFHRDKRSKEMVQSVLDHIPGVGKITAERLLKELKSVAVVKGATHEEISRIVGKARADIIIKYFREH